jgi:hypothetical protein
MTKAGDCIAWIWRFELLSFGQCSASKGLYVDLEIVMFC